MKRSRPDSDVFSPSGSSSSSSSSSSPSIGNTNVSSPSGAASSTTANNDTASAAASKVVVTKRTDYLVWDEYFVAVALLSAQRSKDPSTQVGACIVDAENHICGVGYNGFPTNCSDDDLPWARTADDPLDTKYPYVCHAELNAILNKNQASLKGCRMYVALFPCNECAKLIIQSGITEVIYLSDKYHESTPFVASRRLMDMAGVKYRQHVPTRERVVLDFTIT